MAIDRLIVFKDKRPTKNEFKKILSSYVKGIGSVKWSKNRFFVTLRGKPTNPLDLLFPELKLNKLHSVNERWFEVYIYKKNNENADVDVITRESDFLTRTIADGFVNLLCLHFSAEKIT